MCIKSNIEKLENLNLKELRISCQTTQLEIANKLGIYQEGISRIESQSDIKLSTLQKYLSTLGGVLNLIVEFTDRAPVLLKIDEPKGKE